MSENQPSTLPLPPGKSGLPWIGETISFLTDPDFAAKRRQQYGSIFRTHIIGRPTVVMSGAAANKFILSTNFDKFSWRDGLPDNFKELLGESLFLQEGAEHQRNRKLLMPAFHGKALANYVTTMTEITGAIRLVGKDTVITINSLKQMPYLDRVLREVERMYPPVGGGFRGVVTEFEFNGYRVPKGWQVLYRIPEAHFDVDIYPDPYTFNPDRFDPDRSDYKASDYTFVTYGGSSRICIGIAFAQMELKIIAATLLRRSSWKLLPNQNLTLDPIPTLHPRDGLKVKFKSIEN
jgi:cytochrome P450